MSSFLFKTNQVLLTLTEELQATIHCVHTLKEQVASSSGTSTGISGSSFKSTAFKECSTGSQGKHLNMLHPCMIIATILERN